VSAGKLTTQCAKYIRIATVIDRLEHGILPIRRATKSAGGYAEQATCVGLWPLTFGNFLA
jgi:hypothetical protein